MTGTQKRIGGLTASAVGFVVSLAAAVTHFRLLSNPYEPTFCDVNAAVSCTRVYTSVAGSVADIPVSVFGAIWFAVAGLLAAASLWGPTSLRANAPVYLRILVVPGFFVVALLAFISVAILQTLCVLCVATYVSFLAVAVWAFKSKATPAASFTTRLTDDIRSIVRSPALGGAAAGLALASIAAVSLFRAEAADVRNSANLPLTAEQQEDFEHWLAQQPRVHVSAAAEDEPSNSVEILKFNDYQCPACANAYRSYKSVLAAFQERNRDQVRLATLDFPLDGECNRYVTGAGKHAAACEAAVAVRLARANGRGAEMEEWLFDHQTTLSPETVREAAESIGGVHGFENSYQAQLDLVRRDVERGAVVGVHTTPTFLVGGIRIEGTLPPRYFRALLELAAAGRHGQNARASEAP